MISTILLLSIGFVLGCILMPTMLAIGLILMGALITLLDKINKK